MKSFFCDFFCGFGGVGELGEGFGGSFVEVGADDFGVLQGGSDVFVAHPFFDLVYAHAAQQPGGGAVADAVHFYFRGAVRGQGLADVGFECFAGTRTGGVQEEPAVGLVTADAFEAGQLAVDGFFCKLHAFVPNPVFTAAFGVANGKDAVGGIYVGHAYVEGFLTAQAEDEHEGEEADHPQVVLARVDVGPPGGFTRAFDDDGFDLVEFPPCNVADGFFVFLYGVANGDGRGQLFFAVRPFQPGLQAAAQAFRGVPAVPPRIEDGFDIGGLKGVHGQVFAYDVGTAADGGDDAGFCVF